MILRLYLLICLFTFLSFIGAVIRCIDIVKLCDTRPKGKSKSKVSLYIKIFLVIFTPIIHIGFLLAFLAILFFLKDEELKRVLEKR